MRFSEDFVNRVRDANNIVDVISQYTELKRAGRSLMGLCPFPNHREKTPSFSVSEDKQVYHCFGCKQSGNLVTFLEQIRGMSFREVIEYLAERASIPLPKDETTQAIDETRDLKKVLLKINKLAGAFFKHTLERLPKDHSVWKYLEKRGLSAEIVEEFKIGYEPDDWGGLTRMLQSKGAPLVEAEKLGLIKRRTGGGQSGYYDIFRDRLMFPILNPNGDVIGFGGRILGEGQPKYLNSPESLVFHKGNTLYGLHTTAKYIRALDQVVVVEGYMDLIALYAAGFQNVVATLGTAFTADHARLIQRYTKNVIVLFDGDSAGQEAARRSLPILLAGGLFARGVVLTDKMDPDDAVKKLGAEGFQNLLNNAQDLFLQQLEKRLKNYRGQPAEKVQIFEDMAEVLTQVKDIKLRELYSRELQGHLGVDERWIRLALADFQKKQSERMAKAERVVKSGVQIATANVSDAKPLDTENIGVSEKKQKLRLSHPKKDEILLLNLMLSSSNLLELALESGLIQNSGQSELSEIFEIIEEVYRQSPQDFAKLTLLLQEKLHDPTLVTQHLSKDFDEMVKASGAQLVKDCLEKMKSRFLKNQAKRLAQELKLGQDPEKLEQFMNIQREKHSLK